MIMFQTAYKAWKNVPGNLYSSYTGFNEGNPSMHKESKTVRQSSTAQGPFSSAFSSWANLGSSFIPTRSSNNSSDRGTQRRKGPSSSSFRLRDLWSPLRVNLNYNLNQAEMNHRSTFGGGSGLSAVSDDSVDNKNSLLSKIGGYVLNAVKMVAKIIAYTIGIWVAGLVILGFLAAIEYVLILTAIESVNIVLACTVLSIAYPLTKYLIRMCQAYASYFPPEIRSVANSGYKVVEPWFSKVDAFIQSSYEFMKQKVKMYLPIINNRYTDTRMSVTNPVDPQVAIPLAQQATIVSEAAVAIPVAPQVSIPSAPRLDEDNEVKYFNTCD